MQQPSDSSSSTTSSSTNTAALVADAPGLTPPRANDHPSKVLASDVLKILFIAAAFAAGCALIIVLAPLLLSVLVAAFLAVAADPAVRFFQRRGLGRTPAVLAFTTCLLVVLVGALAIFVPPLVSQGTTLAQDAPGYVDDVRDTKLFRDLDRKYDVVDKGSQAVEKLPKQVGSQLGTVIGTVFAGIFGAVTIIFLMVLLLLGGGEIAGGIVRIVPAIAERRWWRLIIASYQSVSGYVIGTALVAVIAGSVVVVTGFALGLPSVLPLALWMALLDVVPLVGALVGSLPAVAVAFLAGGTTEGIIMMVVLFAYQQLENIVVQPAILGKVVSLSPVIVFISILAGGQLLGITGALLAIPFVGIAQIFLREWIANRSGEDAEYEVPPIAPDDVPDRPHPEPA